MSGLAALFHRDGRPANPDYAWAMLSAVPYRGPDGASVWTSDRIALGHARMAVTPEEAEERQPLVSPRTGCVLISDARLDNRDDLLARLPDPASPDASDAELILRAYESWGIDSAARLLGDFAYVIWDPRRERLVGARDTSGQRTLFYRVDRGTFAAASEIRQLVQDPSVPIIPNERQVRQFLVPMIILESARDQAPETFFDGIFGVPAGHVLVVEPESLRLKRYWDLKPTAELRYRTDDEYAEHFLALFSEVLRTRLRASRTGIMLSGGLDSSSIVCTAQELFRSGRAEDRGVTCLSLVFNGLECDERDLIRDIEAKYGIQSQYIPLTASTDRLMLEPPEVQESPHSTNLRFGDPVYAAASQAGIRVLLTGDVGDACLQGSRLTFDSLLRQGKFREFQRHWLAYRRNSTDRFRTVFAETCVLPFLPPSLQTSVNSWHLKRVFRRIWDTIIPFWMTPSMREELTRAYLELRLRREGQRRFSSPARQVDYDQLYPPEAAPHPAPWPLEIWRPFADRRLHEFLLAIPPEQKFAPHPDTDLFYAGSKRILREAMRGILPESVRTRTTRTHFASVFEDEVARRWSDYEAVFGPSGRSLIADRGYIDRSKFWTRLLMLRDGVRDADFFYLTRVVALETWLRAATRPRVTAAIGRA